MKIALFGNTFSKEFDQNFRELFQYFSRYNLKICIYKPLYDYLLQENIQDGCVESCFNGDEELPSDIDFMFCIGGDGTFLKSIPYLNNFDIPLVGLNAGRLGFLTNISDDEISAAFDAISNGNYEIEMRSLLTIKTEMEMDGFNGVALNEVAILKKDANIISVKVSINGDYLNTYWADGLIIATPTGSTAYALSAGGPIISPSTNCILIAPVASHNLTVRPLIVPDNSIIKIEAHSRNGKVLITADNYSTVVNNLCYSFVIKTSDYKLKMLKLPFNNYYSTLRNKLMWGADKRNW
ncbi:MAG: NAD kinase [Bacteroidales bacterium]|nr:NAD kinase [Bacteroidales bacterium]